MTGKSEGPGPSASYFVDAIEKVCKYMDKHELHIYIAKSNNEL